MISSHVAINRAQVNLSGLQLLIAPAALAKPLRNLMVPFSLGNSQSRQAPILRIDVRTIFHKQLNQWEIPFFSGSIDSCPVLRGFRIDIRTLRYKKGHKWEIVKIGCYDEWRKTLIISGL